MKILVAGDFCPRDRVANAFENNDYASVLEEVRDLTSKVDYSIVNLECPVGDASVKPINKIGPNLRCTEKGVEAVKYGGFDCVTLANNHFLDYGDKGVMETIKVLDSKGIDHVGGGVNLDEASRILYKDFNGERLAIINCCEHEFSIATEKTGGSNPLDLVKQYNAIKVACHNASRVLVVVHGGHEHWQLPSPRMKETYRFFIDAGADTVVNHHQHCFSGYEVYNGKPIFYGLGNFCFDKPGHRKCKWNEGYMVVLNYDDTVGFEIHPYCQCDSNPKVDLLPKNSFDAQIKELNDTISDAQKLMSITNNYYSSCAKQYSNIFEPIRNRYYLAMKQRGWLSSLISKKRKLQAENYICCESHRDKLLWYLYH